MIVEIEVLAAPKFKFEGLKKGSDDQPPVFRPDGRPYDLNDPVFPVVKSKDHVFRYKYWEVLRSAPALIKYLEEHYDYFNKTRFDGKLTRPKILLLKDIDAKKMRLRGRWNPGKRTLFISPNLFNAPHEGWVNRILIHEMAHQYVTDIHGRFADLEEWKHSKGHGPLWQAAMIDAKLPPHRYDYEQNDTYMDEEEKMEKHIDQSYWKSFAGKNYNPKTNDIVGFFTKTKEPKLGVVVGLSVMQKGRFAVLPEPNVFSLVTVEPTNIFRPNAEENLSFFKNYQEKWQKAIDKAVASGMAKKTEGKYGSNLC
jgi:hypothetical protein